MPFYNWTNDGEFEAKHMTIIPALLYIHKSKHTVNSKKDSEKTLVFSWGFKITPFLSFNFQIGVGENKNV